MPSKKQYNLVSDDAYDSRIPLYNEEAFQHGITFHAKYIGSLDVPRPSSRVEIVAAMRRIRYEFKAKSMKKKKVSITVSVDGVKVILRSKRRSNQWPWDENKFIILHHPIYRIFYVSHDSQDLKIFSYIARDGGTNAFKCNVFKSKKKSQAMRIVRTIGQAFEVCHKLSLALASTSGCGENSEETEEHNSPDNANKGKSQGDGASEPNSCDTQEEVVTPKSSDVATNENFQYPLENSSKKNENELFKSTLPGGASKLQESLSVYHHIQMLKEQLEQQNQQMQTVVGQLQLLKDQLSAETAARLEAQTQNHHLLAHNRELLEHIKKLVNHIHQIEEKFHKTEQKDTINLPEPFLSSRTLVSDFDGSFLQNPNFQVGDGKNSISASGCSSVDEPIPSDSLLPKNLSTFAKQLSIPGATHHCSSGNPKLGMTYDHSDLSLPGSPSHQSFSPNLDTIFKLDSFVCSSPKQTRKEKAGSQNSDDVLSNLLTQNNFISHSSSFSQSSISPSHLKSRKQQTFDFEPIGYSSSPLFSHRSSNSKPSKLNANDEPGCKSGIDTFSQQDFTCNSYERNSTNNDSFIAQITRDLAKMNTMEKNLSNSIPANRSFTDPGFSLFKS